MDKFTIVAFYSFEINFDWIATTIDQHHLQSNVGFIKQFPCKSIVSESLLEIITLCDY